MDKKITSAYKLHSAEQLYESISEAANSTYYLFAARPYDSGNTVLDTPSDAPIYRSHLYRNMLFGKRVGQDDVAYVVPRYDWSSNTVFTAYADDDDQLQDKNFYAIVNAVSQYHVWKCLDNANGSISTVQPSIDAVTANDSFYQTSDGYVWKYMSSTNVAMVSKFATVDYFPIFANAIISSAASNGSIDVISVIDAGNNYGNYLAGDNTFGATDLQLEGNNLLYDISSNSVASTANDYYNGCIIYIKAGTSSEVGQFRTITDYVVNSTSKTIVLESKFSNAISVASVFDIYPSVNVMGTGSQSANVISRAIISPIGNVVSTIEILNSGADYESATANVVSNAVVGARDATLRPIMSPEGGHGYDVYSELGPAALTLSVTFSNSESNTILVSNDYRTVGIVRDPLFANVNVELQTLTGLFLNGETVYKVSPIPLAQRGAINTTSNTFTSASGNFTMQFKTGDLIYFSDVNSNAHSMKVVSTVVNSTSLTMTTNGSFTSSNVQFSLPMVTSHGTVISSNTSYLNIGSLYGEIFTGDQFIGIDSGAYAVANTIYRSGVAKGFETFINAHKYVGTVISGTFQEGEKVYQASLSVANAVLHSYTTVTNTNFYVVDQYGNFRSSTNLLGATSNAIASIATIYNPEITFKSGDILYLENISPVTRTPTQQEMFKVTFKF